MSGCDPIYPSCFLKAVGYYRTYCVVLPFDDAVLQGMLPSKLELAPQSVTPTGTHPIVFLFGKHFDVRPNIIPFFGMTYLEYVCAIPFVQFRDSARDYPGPFAYMPKLFLNELWPTILGWLYAYPKVTAPMTGNPPSDSFYSARTLVGDRPLFEGNFERRGPQQPPSDFPHFAALKQIFEIPFIGKFDWTPYICSNLDFKLDQATVQACTADINIQSEFIPGLEPASYTVDGLDTSALGAFYMALPWDLTMPFACNCIDCKP